MNGHTFGFTCGLILLASWMLVNHSAPLRATAPSFPTDMKETDTVILQTQDGVNYSFTMTNADKPAQLHLTPTGDSSDGQWSRSEALHLAAGESKRLRYFFNEPPESTGNVRCCLKMQLGPD